jgi:hypothetical protein
MCIDSALIGLDMSATTPTNRGRIQSISQEFIATQSCCGWLRLCSQA